MKREEVCKQSMSELILEELMAFLRRYRGELVANSRRVKLIDEADVAESVKDVYSLCGLPAPNIVWMTNPWELTLSPSCFGGYAESQMRISQKEDSLGSRVRAKLEKSLGKETFGDFFDRLWDMPIHEELGAASEIVESEIASLRTLVHEPLEQRTELWNALQTSLEDHRQGIEALSTGGPRVDPSKLAEIADHVRRIASAFQSPSGIVTYPIDWSWRSRIRLAIPEVARQFFNLELDTEERNLLDALLKLASTAHAYITFEDTCFVCHGPEMIYFDVNDKIHKEDGPALRYAGNFDVYAWHGLRVPQRAIMQEASLATIKQEWNVEVRRVLIERYGVANYLIDTNSKVIHQDRYGILYRSESVDDEPIVMVEVLNSTPESDGTYRKYFLRVPPTIYTARKAVAWTFGMQGDEYNPEIES